ncbi:MAG: CoA-binding protein [Alphaproteobacteria bacterium]|nr:CoA-binding protein [Alphaproteobacteria bacterium]
MNFDDEDKVIDSILANTKTIALIGASVKEERPSNSVMRNLLKRGYQVFPVNPGHAGGEILGQECFAKLTDIEHEIDMVDVFRRSDAVPEIVEEAIKCQVKILWLQLDIGHAEAEAKARKNGITVISNRCPNIEFRRQESS